MDAETLRSLGWLLLFGVAFFVMMRYGCGAHIMGGHGHHGGRADTEPTAGGRNKDPVCGMMVDPKSAAAASVHGGNTYYFCSTSCRDKFEKVPEKYISASAPGGEKPSEHQHGEHHHG